MYCVSIEKKADSGYQHHYPLERLAVDGLIDLLHTNLTVLVMSTQLHTAITASTHPTYLLMLKIPGTIGLVEPRA